MARPRRLDRAEPSARAGASVGLLKFAGLVEPASDEARFFDAPASEAMVLSLCLGMTAIRQRAVVRHRRWMTRAYALAIAAGTQPLTLVPLLFAPVQETAYMLGMSAGWAINVAVAEWFLRRTPT